MSTRRISTSSAVLAVILLVACGDDDGAAPPPAADSGAFSDSGSTPDAGPALATWSIESNLTVNGRRLDEGIRSVIAQHVDYGSGPGLSIVLTSAAEYCALVRDSGCIADGEVVVSLSVYGTAPGAYTLSSSVDETPGTFSLIYQSIDRDCTGAGIGPSEGTLTITESDAAAVSVQFDTALSFVGASADIGGTLTAPFCD